jgi:hypothetical protein
MKNLFAVLLVVFTLSFSYANDNTTPTAETEMICFGDYVDYVAYQGKIEKTNTFIFIVSNDRTFRQLTKQKIFRYNKGYIKNCKILIKYKNKKTLVNF